ncbi:MAG TPA: hypothetical protein DCP91_11515 [Eggerthellaceae bacterium]|nr:hypothetical protein [Eggerthellaceae bacterium]
MSITLNIAARACAEWGSVQRACNDDNPSFEAVRPYLAGKALRPDSLYVCRTADEASAAKAAGCHVVLVEPGAGQPGESGRDALPDARAGSGADLAVACDASYLDVLDGLLDAAQRFDEWQRAMDRICYSGGTLQELLDAAEPFLKNNVVVLDPALKLLAYTRSVPCDDPITVELIQHGYHTEDNIRKFKLHKRFKPWAEAEGFVVNDSRSICKYVTVVKSFKTRSAFSIISVMMCNVCDPEPALLDAYDLFAQRVEWFAVRDYPDDKPSGNAVDTFLKDLVSGEIADDAVLAERCRYVGIPHEARFCMFYTTTGENSVPQSRLLADVSLAMAPAKTFMVDDAVVVLCFNCIDEKCVLHCMGKRCPHKRRTVSRRMNDLLQRFELACGRSSKFTALSQAPNAYKQAKAAYQIGKARHADGHVNSTGEPNSWSRIYSFDRYAVDFLVERAGQEGMELLAGTYAGTLLSVLARQDAENHTDNYKFLQAYLLHERRASVVAEQLHMHRNNVSYRIGRIEDMLGIDTDDPELRQDLMLAFRLGRAEERKN